MYDSNRENYCYVFLIGTTKATTMISKLVTSFFSFIHIFPHSCKILENKKEKNWQFVFVKCH